MCSFSARPERLTVIEFFIVILYKDSHFRMALKRHISNLSLLFASVGGIIGSGWLFAPFYTARAAGPASIVAWVIGAILICFIALCFAEISSTFPIAGGIVRFMHTSHGTPIAFIISWINWLSFVVVPAIEVQATLQYSAYFFPHLVVQTHHGHPLTLLGFAWATILMLSFVVLNVLGIRLVTRFNTAIVWWKIGVPIIAVATLIITKFHVTNFIGSHGFAPLGLKGIFKALTVGGIVFSFVGFRAAVELAGEAENPSSAILIAVVGSLAISMVIYIALQVAFIGSLNPSDLLQGWQHLHFAGDAGPLAAIAGLLGIIWLVSLLYVDSIISPAGTGIISTASTSRILYSMAKSGFLPKLISRTNRYNVPALAIGINFIAGMLFFLPFPGWQRMMEVLASLSILAYGMGPICLASFRRQIPEQTRPFKIPAYKIFTLITFFISNMVLIWVGWHTIVRLAWLLVIGVVVMGAYVYFHSLQDEDFKHRFAREARSSLWTILYFLSIMTISHFSSYGGTHQLPIGWDFVVTFADSVVIYSIAIYSRLSKQDAQRYMQRLMHPSTAK